MTERVVPVLLRRYTEQVFAATAKRVKGLDRLDGQCERAAKELVRLMRKRGLPARLVYGSFKVDDDELRGHFWVESGEWLCDPTAEQFREFLYDCLRWPRFVVARRQTQHRYVAEGAVGYVRPTR